MTKETPSSSKQSEAKARRAAALGLVFKNGWYVLPSRGAVVANQLIDEIQEELDRDDARAAGARKRDNFPV
jgi:hypothetical protein